MSFFFSIKAVQYEKAGGKCQNSTFFDRKMAIFSGLCSPILTFFHFLPLFYRFLSKNPVGLVKGFSKTRLKPRTFFRQNRHFFYRFLTKKKACPGRGFLKVPTKPHRIFSSKIVIFRQKVPFFQNDPDTLFWGRGGYRTGPFLPFLPLFPKIPPKRSFFRAL